MVCGFVSFRQQTPKRRPTVINRANMSCFQLSLQTASRAMRTTPCSTPLSWQKRPYQKVDLVNPQNGGAARAPPRKRGCPVFHFDHLPLVCGLSTAPTAPGTKAFCGSRFVLMNKQSFLTQRTPRRACPKKSSKAARFPPG